MPRPVSRTHTTAPPSSHARALRRVTDAAGRRELDGVADQVAEDLAQLGRIALDGRQLRRRYWLSSVTPTSTAVGLKEASATCRISSSSTSRASSVYLPLCILEMSRMSLMTASRCVAASRMRSAYSTISRVLRAGRLLVLAEQLGKADHRVERRPQLMAHVGDEFGFDLARQLGLDAGRVLGQPSLVPQHRIGEQRRILGHQRAAACPALLLPLNMIRTDDLHGPLHGQD